MALQGSSVHLPGQYHALMNECLQVVNEIAVWSMGKTPTYTLQIIRGPNVFPGHDSLYQVEEIYFTRENVGFLGWVHGLRYPEVILNQFLAVSTCFIFIGSFTVCIAFSLIVLCMLYYKSYLPQ